MYWKDKTRGILIEDLFTTKAEAEAKKLERFTSSQFRNYFSEIRSLEGRLEAELEKTKGDTALSWDRTKPFVYMLKSKLAYAQREQVQIPQAFVEFLGRAIDATKDFQDFGAFVKYVEAVLAYFYAFEKKVKDDKRGSYNGGRR
jgi:CRISPR-associated protein Csm2